MALKLKAGHRPTVLISLAAVLLLSACSKSNTSSSGGTTSVMPAQGGGVTVSTASVPGVGMVLVDSSGSTLYYLKTESNGGIKCTGSCASIWPPLLLPAGTTSATAGSGVTASKLGSIKRPDGGTQVTYNGMPLYTFASDQPGQATGQGVNGFFVESPSGNSSNGGGGNGGGY